MIEPHPEQVILNAVVDRLGLKVADDKAFGEILGSPVALSPLGIDPLALLLAFKIRSPHPTTIDCPSDIAALAGQKFADVSLEKGFVWLSLDNLSGLEAESIVALIQSFANSLVESNVALEPGCAQCQSFEELSLEYSGSRCTRLCDKCRVQVLVEKHRAEEQFNRPNTWFALGLLPVFLFVSVSWALGWFLLDVLLEEQPVVILIGSWTILVALFALVVIALVLGYPTGLFLRRAGLPERFARWSSTATVILACLVGEWFYVALLFMRQLHTFNLILAAEAFLPVVQNYPSMWVIGKVLVGIAIICGCVQGMKSRQPPGVKL